MFFLLFSFFLLLLPSCSYQQSGPSYKIIKQADIPLFIEMPKNNMVFDNVSPLVYQAVYHHFQQLGYRLVSRKNDGYTLTISIKSLEPAYKLISPDILLFHSTIKIELVCSLLDFDHKIVAQKIFLCSGLISKPRNPILNSDFLEFNYKRILALSTPKIEQYMRPFLLKAFE